MAGGATEVHQPALGQQVNAVAARKGVFVHLRLDVELGDALGVVQAVHLDFVVEVANVADDGLVFHLRHVLERDDVAVAGGGDVDVRLAERVFDGLYFKTFHRGLQSIDGVNLGDDDARAEAAQRVRAAFADVAVTAYAGDLAGDHHVGRALDAVGERFAAAVEVVELGLGDGVVDVDGRHEQLALFQHLVQAMDAGGGFLGNTFPILHDGVPAAGPSIRDALSQGLDDGDFVVVAGGVDPVVAVFEFVTLVDEQGGVAPVVHNELRSFVARMRERGERKIPIFLERFTLVREDRRAGNGNGGGGVVLRRENVATRPAHGRAEFDQGLDENRRL